MRNVIRLGWPQLAIVAGSLGALLVVTGIAFMPQLQDVYAREFLLPRMADQYGFQFGKVHVSCDGDSYFSPGIVSVRPDGTFAGMGVRAGDIPFAFHGNGGATMYDALKAGERGQVAEFDVLNAADCKSKFRTIHVQPRGTVR